MVITNTHEPTQNISKMAARSITFICLCVMLSACAVVHTPPVIRIALLAPFEGRYREVGYDLLYAARLALQEGGYKNVQLLPIDDGGTIESARNRAAALSADPLVKMVLVAGYAATDPGTQEAFADIPQFVVGHWDVERNEDTVFILAHPELAIQPTAPPRIEVTDAAELPAPIIGGEVFALKQFPLLRDNLEGITILSSASLADSDFSQRYLTSDLYVPPPGLLTTLAYDATHLAAQTVASNPTRTEVLNSLQSTNYTGINGIISFDNSGYWSNAPLRTYRYNAERELTPSEDN
jgi:ABC-type branched-subunit amino acid transport system substrate-binding protein